MGKEISKMKLHIERSSECNDSTKTNSNFYPMDKRIKNYYFKKIEIITKDHLEQIRREPDLFVSFAYVFYTKKKNEGKNHKLNYYLSFKESFES